MMNLALPFYSLKDLIARTGLALTHPWAQIMLWGVFAWFFVALLVLRNAIEVDYEGFLDAGKHFFLRDPVQPVYQAGNGYYNPLWVAALLGPFGLLPDRALGIQLWRLAEVLFLFISAYLWLERLPRSQRGLWSALSVVFLPAWQGVEYGQVVGLMLLGYSLVKRGLSSGTDGVLAAGMVLLTAKPNLSAAPLLVVLIYLGAARRWRGLWLSLGALAGAILLPLLWYPGWVQEWAASILAAPPGLYSEPTNVFQLAYLWAGTPVAVAVGVAVFLAALTLGTGLLRSPAPRAPVLGVLSALGILASPQVAYLYDLALLLPALWALCERPATLSLALGLFLFPLTLAVIGHQVWAILYPCGAVACVLAGLSVGRQTQRAG